MTHVHTPMQVDLSLLSLEKIRRLPYHKARVFHDFWYEVITSLESAFPFLCLHFHADCSGSNPLISPFNQTCTCVGCVYIWELRSGGCDLCSSIVILYRLTLRKRIETAPQPLVTIPKYRSTCFLFCFFVVVLFLVNEKSRVNFECVLLLL